MEAFRRAFDLGQAEVRVNPRDAKAVARLAVVESKLGRQEDAARSIDKAVALEPGNADVRFAQAIVFTRAGRLDEAILAVREALRVGYSRLRAGKEPELRPLRLRADFNELIQAGTGGAQ